MRFPAYSNEVIMTLHSTALASTVAMMEITGAASLFVTNTYQPFIAYSAAACIYLVLNLVLVYASAKSSDDTWSILIFDIWQKHNAA